MARFRGGLNREIQDELVFTVGDMPKRQVGPKVGRRVGAQVLGTQRLMAAQEGGARAQE